MGYEPLGVGSSGLALSNRFGVCMTMDWKLPASDTYFRSILDKTPEGFELDHLEYALTYVKSFRTAVDGGAHIGTWAVAMAKLFDTVWAFEPSADTFACLWQNTRYVDNIRNTHAALGPVDGQCQVYPDKTRLGNTGARTVVPDVHKLGTSMFTLDGFDLQGVDFLKLDVEGYEEEALKGCVETIKRWQPVIIVELKQFTPQRYDGPKGTVRLLRSLGYHEVGGVRNDRVFIPND